MKGVVKLKLKASLPVRTIDLQSEKEIDLLEKIEEHLNIKK